MPHILSKTTYLLGCQCPKRLALHKFRPELRNPPDPQQEALFMRGTNVGLLAQQLFPGGVDASPPNAFSYHVSVDKTSKLIAAGVPVIYEAAFNYEGLLCAVDILVKDGNLWHAYEVKSSTEVKDQHIVDAGYQYAVIASSGLAIGKFHIVHINRDYIRRGDVDISQLFTVEDITDDVRVQRDEVVQRAAMFKALVKSKQVPEISIGPQCSSPYGCDFTGFCWEHVPADSVFELAGNLHGLEWDLYNKGIVKLLDIPADQRLSKNAAIQLEHYRSGEPRIEREAILSFLRQLTYPLYFLDFETYMEAVPSYDGMRPYQQIPFQYSLHIVPSKDAEIQHREFLGDANSDPRQAFADALFSDITQPGTLVAYNASFEISVLKKLAVDFPQHDSSVRMLLTKAADLMVPFRQKDYYHPEFKGSYSIKDVLPVLVPELSYKSLLVRDGGMAGLAYFQIREETEPIVIENIRKALLEYCKLDTWAMVKIWERLQEIVTNE